MKSSQGVWLRRAGLLVPAALFLIGNLIFFFAYGTDTRSREEALENRRKALEQEVASAEADASRLAAQRDRLAQVSSALEEFYGRRIGPRRDTLAPVVEDVHALLRRAGIAPAQISYQTASVPDLPLSEMLISFGFRSDYAKFKRLLQLLESSPRWILVRDAGLARDAETPGSVDVRLVLATYFSGDEGAAPRQGPEARRGTLAPGGPGAAYSRGPATVGGSWSPAPPGDRAEARRGTLSASPRSHDRREARRGTSRSPVPPGRSPEPPGGPTGRGSVGA